MLSSILFFCISYLLIRATNHYSDKSCPGRKYFADLVFYLIKV